MMYRFAVIAAVVAVLAAAPQPLSGPQIFAHMSANRAGLNTFQVPVNVNGKLHEVVSIPITLSGTRYFQAPDREALKFDSVPGAAKAFQDLYSSLGTPMVWDRIYNVTSVVPQAVNGHDVYELRCVYKRESRVDHILMDVDTTTYAPVQVRWFYKNGATIVMSIDEKTFGKYMLPSHQALQIHFPQYSAQADVYYGDYVINQPIPPDTFQTPAP
jgi:hypothetical protein